MSNDYNVDFCNNNVMLLQNFLSLVETKSFASTVSLVYSSQLCLHVCVCVRAGVCMYGVRSPVFIVRLLLSSSQLLVFKVMFYILDS